MKAILAIEVKIEFIKEEGYVAYADIFGAYGMGDTKAQSQQSLKRAIDIYVDEYLKQGVLLEKLQAYGFEKNANSPTQHDKIYQKMNVNIPLNAFDDQERLYA